MTGWDASRVEAQRGTDPVRDRAGDPRERVCVISSEVAFVFLAGDMNRSPAASAADERRPQFVRDPRRYEHVSVTGAAFGLAVGRAAEDPDRNPASCKPRERVHVLDDVLAGEDQRSRVRERLGREHALADQFLSHVAGDQPRLRIERMPAGRVAIDHSPQTCRDLGAVLLKWEAFASQQSHVLDQLLDPPARCGHAPTISRPSARPRRRARNIPATEGSKSAGQKLKMLLDANHPSRTWTDACTHDC
jgi:hypothetical protein